jgi:hypothetical protein
VGDEEHAGELPGVVELPGVRLDGLDGIGEGDRSTEENGGEAGDAVGHECEGKGGM